MLKKIVIALLSVFLLLTTIPGCTASSGSLSFGNSVGNKAYDFSLPDLKGNTVTLSGLSGRPVFLNFWYTG
jgi:cytochrome oxidase Cu insertion factor (SCO1/SenC/PrrC family)